MLTAHAEDFASSLTTTAAGAAVLETIRESVRTRAWPWLDDLGQPHRGGWTDGAVAMAGKLHAAICIGEIVMARVWVGAEPMVDRERSANDAALRGLAAPFQAQLHGQNNSPAGDGDAWWDEVVTLEAAAISHGSTFVPARDVAVPPMRVPLEVGATHPATTWWHIQQYGGLMRWAYGSGWARVLVAAERAEAV